MNMHFFGAPAKFVWTPRLTEMARVLWVEKGYSASEIAAQLGHGVTRSMVLGKMHRIKAEKPQTASIWTSDMVARMVALDEDGHSHARIADALGCGVTASAVRSKLRSLDPAHRSKAIATAQLLRPLPKEPLAPLPEPDAPSITPQSMPAETDPPRRKLVSVLDIRDGMCRWVEGDHKRQTAIFCGCKVHEGYAYCTEHAQRVYSTFGKTRSQRAKMFAEAVK